MTWNLSLLLVFPGMLSIWVMIKWSSWSRRRQSLARVHQRTAISDKEFCMEFPDKCHEKAILVRETLSSHLGIDKNTILPTDNLGDDLALDDAFHDARLSFILMLEEKSATKIPDAKANSFSTVAEVVEFLCGE